MVRTWRRELGLAREKHRTTTSDLEGEKRCLVQGRPLSRQMGDTAGRSIAEAKQSCSPRGKGARQRDDVRLLMGGGGQQRSVLSH